MEGVLWAGLTWAGIVFGSTTAAVLIGTGPLCAVAAVGQCGCVCGTGVCGTGIAGSGVFLVKG